MKKKLAPHYLEKIEKQLRELGNKIDELNAKVKEESKCSQTFYIKEFIYFLRQTILYAF